MLKHPKTNQLGSRARAARDLRARVIAKVRHVVGLYMTRPSMPWQSTITAVSVREFLCLIVGASLHSC